MKDYNIYFHYEQLVKGGSIRKVYNELAKPKRVVSEWEDQVGEVPPVRPLLAQQTPPVSE